MIVFACFLDDFTFGNYAPNISCYNNYVYSSYKGANVGNNTNIPN